MWLTLALQRSAPQHRVVDKLQHQRFYEVPKHLTFSVCCGTPQCNYCFAVWATLLLIEVFEELACSSVAIACHVPQSRFISDRHLTPV